jgi:hypothetical protein
MDRRRFVPSTEGLEGRAMLSVFGNTLTTTTTNTSQNLPQTFQEKERRIDRLPSYMEKLQPGRFLPADVTAPLQTDLRAIAARLHPPGSAVLDGFNSRLRDVIPSPSLGVSEAKTLNRAFGVVLAHAGATPQQVENLQNDMNALARVDAKSSQPVFLATNDYTLVLQTALGVGRPIRRPGVPVLAAHNGTRVNPNFGITPRHQPTLVGTYDAHSVIQIVDDSGRVYGAAEVKANGPTSSNGQSLANGKYDVTFAQPLADGVYTFHVRAVDVEGHTSKPSQSFKLKVITDTRIEPNPATTSTPGGPLGLNTG